MKSLENIAGLMTYERINMLDSDAVIKSLKATTNPEYSIGIYLDAQLVGKHISDVSPGDTVLHNDIVRTVSRGDIQRDSSMGALLFGDSYSLGNKPVIVITNVRF